MNPLDIGVIVVIGLSAIFAFARGFVREALSIVAWVGAAFVTLYAFAAVYALVDPMVKNPLLSNLIAGFGLFVGSLIVLTILTGIVARSVRSSALSPIDRTLGFIFGLLRGAVVVSLAYLLIDMVQLSERPTWLLDAKSGPYLHQGADLLRTVLPEWLKLKTTAAAEEAIQKITPAAEAQKAIRAYVNPTAPAQPLPDQASPPTYRPGDRKELDRLIGNQH